jgi:hypothetical protein
MVKFEIKKVKLSIVLIGGMALFGSFQKVFTPSHRLFDID